MRGRSLVLMMALMLCAAMAALAQPPVPQVPAPGTVKSSPVPVPIPPMSPTPASVSVPSANSDHPSPVPQVRTHEALLSRYENLAAFPAQTQSAVRSLLLAANWLTRMNQPNGRFIYGFNPALRQPLARDNDLHQARAALAMARLARFSGDEKHLAIASQAILTLLASTREVPADPGCRVPVHSSLVCNRVGFAATLALAIDDLPGADPKLSTAAEQLVIFLRKQCRSDGSIHYTDGEGENSQEVDPSGVNEYPGVALQAIAVSHRLHPQPGKLECVQKGLSYYLALMQSRPHPLLAATISPAAAELYHLTGSSTAAAAVFDLNDTLCRYQIPANDSRLPQGMGGFRTAMNGPASEVPSGPETGDYLQSLCHARRIARLVPDLDRHDKYRAASLNTLQYLSDLQFVETNTRHFENAFRANMLIGSFHLQPTDGTVRIDATATAVTGLLPLLTISVDRE